jgi:hypothetical protein
VLRGELILILTFYEEIKVTGCLLKLEMLLESLIAGRQSFESLT